jgi:hypothetical protein
MRTAYPVGQKFLLEVQIKEMGTDAEWLYSNYRDKWHPLTDPEATAYVDAQFSGSSRRMGHS